MTATYVHRPLLSQFYRRENHGSEVGPAGAACSCWLCLCSSSWPCQRGRGAEGARRARRLFLASEVSGALRTRQSVRRLD